MITLETLQTINADLDAERRQRNNVPQNISNLRLKNVQFENERSVGNPAILSEEVEDSSSETDLNDTEHMKLHDIIMASYALFARIYGMEISFQWHWKKHFLFWVSTLSLIMAWVCITYTEYIHFVNGDFVNMIEPLAIGGVTASVTQKWISYILYWNAFIALIKNLRSICRRSSESSSRANILKTELRKTYKFLTVFGVLILSAPCLYVLIPAKILIVNKEVMALMPVEVPFCDQSTLIGFIVATVVHAEMGFHATICIVLYQLTFVIIICFYSISVNLLAEDFKDLDQMWTRKSKTTIAYRHAFLLNICKKRQDMNCYINWIKKLYETKLIYYFCTNYVCQIISLYQITINGWLGGYGPFGGLFMESMFYCYMGTHISKSDDQICNTIYNKKWYEYDLISQRTILMLLHEAQMSRDLQIGFMGPLNMITFISIVKSMYSYYTVLTEML